jgi:hypothetical protein
MRRFAIKFAFQLQRLPLVTPLLQRLLLDVSEETPPLQRVLLGEDTFPPQRVLQGEYTSPPQRVLQGE